MGDCVHTYGGGRWRKHYVGVVVHWAAGGMTTPLEVVWDDGRRLPVEQVAHPRHERVRKVGGAALRYPVRIYGKPRDLYRDDTGWFDVVRTFWP